jgi:hypothetical protein
MRQYSVRFGFHNTKHTFSMISLSISTGRSSNCSGRFFSATAIHSFSLPFSDRATTALSSSVGGVLWIAGGSIIGSTTSWIAPGDCRCTEGALACSYESTIFSGSVCAGGACSSAWASTEGWLLMLMVVGGRMQVWCCRGQPERMEADFRP